MNANALFSEFRSLLLLGFPIMVAQVAQTAMGFVDTLMAGQVSTSDLAAVALGSSIFMPLMISLSGILMATTPLVAHKVGANNLRQTTNIAQHGMLVSILTAIIAVTLLNNSYFILEAMNVETKLAAKTVDYLHAISWGFPAILLYQVLRSYSEGFGKTRPIMKIALLGLLCNIPLNYIFIYGKLGLPALGAEGCGWASALVMWIMLIVGAIYTKNSETFKEAELFGSLITPSKETTSAFLKLGIPIGLSLLIETSMFGVISLLLAESGEIIVAAHQITLSFTSLVFMIPLSLSIAITITIGQRLGADQPKAARQAAISGLALTISFATASATTMFLAAEHIASWYTSNTMLIQIAAELIIIAGIFQISDSIQVTSAGALRGYKDTSIPLAMAFTAYWVVGLPSGYILALTDFIVPALSAKGFWLGLVFGLSTGAILLSIRLFYVARKHNEISSAPHTNSG